MGANRIITVSAPTKVHLLGEHAVVYGKPALLTTVDLRVTVTVIPSFRRNLKTKKQESGDSSLIAQNDRKKAQNDIKKIIEPIVKRKFKLKSIPSYTLSINTKAPIGSGLGSSAAISASYIAALLSFLKIKWDLSSINDLTYEAEKVFHGNPSGADNSTVVFGGLIWFRKESPEFKLIQQVPFSIPSKIAKNFILIHTGKPKQTTKDIVIMVKKLYDQKPNLVNKFLRAQEILVRELLIAIKMGQEKEVIRIIKEGEKNLESIGVCSPTVKKIIRQIEDAGGAAKVCGGGSSEGPTGVLLIYHSNPSLIKNIAKSFNLDYFQAKLGVEGLRQEKL